MTVPPHEGGEGALHHTMVALKLQQFQYNLKKRVLLVLFGQNDGSSPWAMRQRILGSHTPPCHRRMVITTLSSILPLGGGVQGGGQGREK